MDHSDVTSLPEVPAKTTLEDLMSKIKHLSDPSTVKSVEMSWTEYSQSGDIVHRERYPVHLARYINEIISFRNMLEEVRDFKSWLVELLPWDHAVVPLNCSHRLMYRSSVFLTPIHTMSVSWASVFKKRQ